MSRVLGIYMSPRAEGNSDLLLDAFLAGAREAGAVVETIYIRDHDIQACAECAGCDETGECVLTDDMDDLYPLMMRADRVVVAAPIFFYGLPSGGKALVDRCQALWNRVRLDPDQRRSNGRGFFLGVGATKGKDLFEGSLLTVKYFMDAIGLPAQTDELTFRQVEAKGDIKNHPDALKQAHQAGTAFAAD
ncbi:MAG: flavodoxin family protein [Proteobacteria bacterium]|nr:flavodoxin family protein [Pseudomonadota bacterium]